MNTLKVISSNLFVPLFISVVFASAVIYAKEIPSALFSLIPYIFYTLLAVILWVSWHFNRHRFIFITLALIGIKLGFTYLLPQKATYLFNYVSILFPLHLLVFLLLKERGFFSIWGILKLLFFAIELGVVIYFVNSPLDILNQYIKLKIFAQNLYPLKDLAVAVSIFVLFIMSGVVLFGSYVLYATSFLVMLLSFEAGLYFLKTPHALDMAFLNIAVIMFTLLIRESYRLAFYDELTNLPGRRALMEDMAKLGRRYSLAMCDIDHFKKFNDTYGHDTGDEVLKMVATKLSEVKGGGKAYRYGGEEFTILFPSKGVDESFVYVDAIRQNIASTPFRVRGKKSSKNIFVHISAGIVENSSDDNDVFAVMKRADNALYKAKKAGRNRVIKA